MEEHSDEARVAYTCEGCDAKTYVKSAFEHDEEQHKERKSKKALKRMCEKAGTPPHALKQ